VDGRASKDIQLEEISKTTLESARTVLERKAKIYDKLRRGKSGGLSDKQYEALLVDVRFLFSGRTISDLGSSLTASLSTRLNQTVMMWTSP